MSAVDLIETRQHAQPQRPLTTLEAALLRRLDQLERRLERADRRFDEFAAAYLNARFPYGQPDDRWKRRP